MSRGGNIRLTASGLVNDSGKPQRVYGLSIDSGAIGGVVTLRNGTSATDIAVASPQGSANQRSVTPNWPAEGVYFDKGLYASLDANVTAAMFFVEQISTT